MSMYMRLSVLTLMFGVSACTSLPVSAESAPNCGEAFFANRGASVGDLVEQSDMILLASPSEFTLDHSNPPFDGFYTFISSGTVLKGDRFLSTVNVWGSLPLQRIPQSYMDITAQHGVLDMENLYEGIIGVIETEDGCFFSPEFLIGWNYLLLLGVHTGMAYEPIHSPNLDAWFAAVESAANSTD